MAAVARENRALGRRNRQSSQFPPKTLEAIPCQKSPGGLVLRCSVLAAGKGSHCPVSAVNRAICR